MTTPAQAAGSSVPCVIGDKTYMLSPLVDRQWGDLTLWMQARQLRIAKAAIDPDLDETEARRELTKALSVVNRLDARMVLTDVVFTMDGFNFWLWQMLRKCHEKITLEDVAKMIEENPKDSKNVYEAWSVLQGETKEKDPPQAATAARATTE